RDELPRDTGAPGGRAAAHRLLPAPGSSHLPGKRYVVATDVGGTCTDTIVVAPDGGVHIGKALSTPPDFADGVIASMRVAAGAIGIGLDDLLAATELFIHGSTVVDNTVLTRAGSPTGLIATEGFE